MASSRGAPRCKNFFMSGAELQTFKRRLPKCCRRLSEFTSIGFSRLRSHSQATPPAMVIAIISCPWCTVPRYEHTAYSLPFIPVFQLSCTSNLELKKSLLSPAATGIAYSSATSIASLSRCSGHDAKKARQPVLDSNIQKIAGMHVGTHPVHNLPLFAYIGYKCLNALTVDTISAHLAQIAFPLTLSSCPHCGLHFHAPQNRTLKSRR